MRKDFIACVGLSALDPRYVHANVLHARTRAICDVTPSPWFAWLNNITNLGRL
jgi:hypothetical protein